jgi:hypothetical protein
MAVCILRKARGVPEEKSREVTGDFEADNQAERGSSTCIEYAAHATHCDHVTEQ